MVYDNVCVANVINDYFSSVISNDKLPIAEPVQTFNGSPDNRLTDCFFTKEDVCKLLTNLKTVKAPGPDRMYSRV